MPPTQRRMTEPAPTPAPDPTTPPEPAESIPPEFAERPEREAREIEAVLGDRYVVLQSAGLTVWARKPPHDASKPGSQGATIMVPRGGVLRHPEWIADDAEESAILIEQLLELGAIARVSDVRAGKAHVPAESVVDEEGRVRPPEERPMTVLAVINRQRELEGQPPIQMVKVGPKGKERFLVSREVQPMEAPAGMVAELVPAATGV